LSRTLRARHKGAADTIHCLRGAKRRTTTRIKPTWAVKAFGFPTSQPFYLHVRHNKVTIYSKGWTIKSIKQSMPNWLTLEAVVCWNLGGLMINRTINP